MGLEALPDKAPEIAGAAALGVAKKPQFGSVTVMDQGVKVPNKILYGPNGRPVNLPAELVDGAKAKALMGLIRRRP
jgi:hypothetical protein